MVLQTNIAKQVEEQILAFSERVRLSDGKFTTVHCVRYARHKFEPRLVVFDKPTRLLEWCQHHGYDEAITAGYFLRSDQKLLGETWLNGRHVPSVSFNGQQPRSCLHIYNGQLKIAPRNELPVNPVGDLVQLEPVLVHKGLSTFMLDDDPEGYSDAAHQHDEPLNSKRFPRAAIGYNKDYLWTVTADGRSPTDAGLYLEELTDILIMLGVQEAINLDGGSSATHISNCRLLNRPRNDYREAPNGFEIYSALIFSPKIIKNS